MKRVQRRAWTVPVLLAIGGGWYRFAELGGFTNDHFVHLAMAQQLWLGGWPLRDFADPGMPLMYALSALVQVPFGRGLLGEALLTSIMLGLGSAATFLALRKLTGTSWPALAGGLLVVLMRPRHYSYPKIVVFAVAVWMLAAYADRPSRRRAIGIGVLIAVATLFRHDFGVYLAIATIVAFVLTHAADVLTGMRRAGLALAVAFAGIVPYLIYVERAMGLREYVRVGIEFSVLENQRTRGGLPAFNPAESFISDHNAETWMYYAVVVLPILVMLVLIFTAWTSTRQLRFQGALAASAVLATMLGYAFVREAQRARLADAAVLTVILGTWLCWLALRGSWRRPIVVVPKLGVTALAAATACAALVVGEAPIYIVRAAERLPTERTHLVDLSRHLAVAPPVRNIALARAGPELRLARYFYDCLSDGDRPLVVGFVPQAFAFSGRGFAGGHPRFIFGMLRRPAEQRQMMAWLERENVPIIIDAPGASIDFYPLLYARVQRLYEAPIAFADGFQVYAKRDRAPVRLWPATPLPCYR